LSPTKTYPASVTNVHGVLVVIPAVVLHVLAVLVAQLAWSAQSSQTLETPQENRGKPQSAEATVLKNCPALAHSQFFPL